MQRNYIPKNIDTPDIKYESITEKLNSIIAYANDHDVRLAALCVNYTQYCELCALYHLWIRITTPGIQYCGVPLRLHNRAIPVGVIQVEPVSDFSYPFVD